ncbi:type III-A CRISPR-associated RAMP protein Csm5 [Aquifex sp.]
MRLKTLTPVHIGDGEEIIPWEYELIGSKRLRVYSFEGLLKELKEKFSGSVLKSTLKRLAQDIRVNGFRKSLGEFLKENRLNLKGLYELETKTSLRRGDEYKGVKSFIKSSGKVYIPGSEVKGALRTVFIFGAVYRDLNKGNKESLNFVIKTVEEALKSGRSLKDKKFWQDIEQRLENHFFIEGAPEEDAKYDLFKVLRVSDSFSKEPSESLYVDDVTLLGSRRVFYDPHELLREGQEFELSIEVDNEYRSFLKRLHRNPYIDLLSLEFLQESAYNFYRFLLGEEEAFFDKFPLEKAHRDLERVKRSLSKGEFVLRIGKHQGFLSLTVMLLVKLGAKELYRRFYERFLSAPGKPVNKTRKITKEGHLLGFCTLQLT